jgi:hypothetical protein
MKLLVEIQDHNPVKMITEGEGSNKKHFIEGLFLEFDSPNRNKRIYKSEHHDPAVYKYIEEKVKNNSAWGELDHPDGPVISLKNASHRITSLTKEGKDWFGKAQIVPNAVGNIVVGLLQCEGNLGVSSRGMGNVKEIKENIMEVQPGFKFLTAGDIVSDPSAHKAFVKGIMENTEYFYDESKGTWLPEAAEELKKEIKKMSLSKIEESKLRLFENFLNNLKINI